MDTGNCLTFYSLENSRSIAICIFLFDGAAPDVHRFFVLLCIACFGLPHVMTHTSSSGSSYVSSSTRVMFTIRDLFIILIMSSSLFHVLYFFL
jgi:hypothetical protein